MKRKITFLMAAFLLLCGFGWAQSSSSEVTDELNYELIGVTGNSYNNWTGITSESDAVYAGNSAGGNYSIQLRSSNSNSGIVTTTSGGVATKISVTWNENTTNGRTLNVYGKNSAYTAATDLYNASNQGTLLGTIVYGTSTELSITDNYLFIGIRSNNAALYLDAVEIVWEVGGDTPVPTYTVTYDCNGGTDCPENVTGLEAGEDIELADGPAKDGYDFAGWSDGNNIYDEGETYTVNGNVTFTAQWTSTSGEPEQWVLTDLANLTENDVFVIVGNNGSNYAMTNNNGTDSAPAAFSVTVEDDMITSEVKDNIKWNISGNATDGYTFYPNGTTETWLYCTNTNNGVRVGGNNAKTFKINNDYLYHNGTSRYVGIYNSSDWRCYTSINNNISGQTFGFYKKVTGDVLPPSITADNVSIEYNVESGVIAYTISNGVDGGVLTANTESDWLILGEVGETVPFTCSANDAGTARTATVTLTYSYGDNETVVKNVTVTQAAAPVIYTTIPELFNAATSTETSVLVTFNNWVVSGVSTNGKNVFVTDNNGNGFIIFDNNGGLDQTYSVGNILSGTAISCTLKKYNGFAELLNVNSADLTITTGGTVTEANIAMADLAGVNTGVLLHYDNLTCNVDNNKYYLTDGTTTLQVYNTLYAFEALEDGKTYNITGVYQQYNSTKEILPRSANDIEEVVSTEPSITVTPNTINAPVDGAEGTLNIIYENIPDLISFDYYFCDANGTELEDTDPDWINAAIEEDNDGNYSVEYTIDANTGDARTAYFKVYTFVGDDEVYCIVTVNQGAYVAPPTDGDYLRISSIDQLTDGSKVIIAARHNNTVDSYYAMKNTSSGKPEGVQFTSSTTSDGEVVSSTITDDQDSYYWTVNVTNDGYTFTNANSELIGYPGNGTSFATGNNTTWTIEKSTAGDNAMVATYEGFVIQNGEVNTRAFAFNGTAFGAYATTNMNAGGYNFYLDFFVQVDETPDTETHTLEIVGYDDNDGGYYLIASPVTVDPTTAVDPDTQEHMILTGEDAVNYDLYYFDEAQTEEWRNYKQDAFNLEPGKGYLYAHKRGGNFTLTGTPYEGNGQITLNKQGNGTFAGWNLVGNPYNASATIDRNEFYVMRSDGGEIIPGEESTIAAMQGIFVIAEENGETVTFSPYVSLDEGAKIVINVMKNRNTIVDRAIVNLNNHGRLPKFMLNPDNTKVYIPQDNIEYAVAKSEDVQGEMPINFHAAENGTYTFRVNAKNTEMDYLHLIDNKTGEEIDLKANPNYSFDANVSDIEARFTLIFNANTGVNENVINTFAYFNGSEWIINNTDNATVEVVDMLGRVVMSQNAAQHISTSTMASGVYTLRLTNGNEVKTQKIVVK